MKLINVTIRGFRSIENMTIPFGGYGHKILVGKNESGKSNILKALRLLSSDTFNKDQKKRSLGKKAEASVIFQFDLEQDESTKCKGFFVKKFFAIPDTKLTNIHTVESFYNEYSHILYSFDIDQKVRWNRWTFSNGIQIASGWHEVNQNIADQGLTGHDDIPVGSYIHDSYIKKEFIKDELDALHLCLSETDAVSIRTILHSIVKNNITLEAPPLPIVYWEYSSKEYDLPKSINMDEFSNNPDICQPLQNMFLLDNYKKEDIQKELTEARQSGYNATKSLLDSVNRATNDYIKENWKEYNKEYENVKIELRENSADIVIGIKDSPNTYDFDQRSDGFRRFISFLLLMTQKSNSLIILDEPETGLHPSSAKDLRNVLIKLGKKNIVVYATHSISMIDTQNIENNLVVIKEGEDTSCKLEKEDGTSSGELIYNAIGYSIYNELKKKNILLEGYTDKKVLKSFMRGFGLKDFGICYTDGVKNIKKIVPLLELADREYFILSDADDAAKQSKKENNFEHWYTYAELGSKAITLEDFYTKDFFNGVVKSVLKKYDINTEDFSFDDINDDNRIDSVKNLLPLKTLSDKKKVINDIKQECANKPAKAKIDVEKLNLVLEEFSEKIQPKKIAT